MDRIETKNLVLRKARLSDLEAIYENIWSDKSVAETMMWKPTECYEEAVDRLKRTMVYQSQHPAFFVCLKETDEPIGFAGMREEEPGVYEETGICVAVKYQNRGFGKEILGALLELTFVHYEGERFIYAFMQHNIRSKNVCLRHGFQYAGQGEEIREWDQKPHLCEYYALDRKSYLEKRGKVE